MCMTAECTVLAIIKPFFTPKLSMLDNIARGERNSWTPTVRFLF